MSGEVTRDIPASYIVFLIADGLIIVLLTPIEFWLRPWINPFGQANPTDSISSVVFLVLFSLVPGSIGFLLKNNFIGNNGLNRWLKFKFATNFKEKFQKSS
jgi:hypothetical protein